ncbi:hypothetical protein BX666DRAFT_332312 [Dichotomocladium elegans]|nr:hypothetical protein BX666DRAFT_332312 [Dichotomocladium elegans]
MTTCQICHKDPWKYKCPTCRIQYCSVTCFKQHKLEPCAPPAPEKTPEGEKERRQLPTDSTDDDDPSRLTLDQLTSIGHSNQVLRYLENPAIREWVSRIDQSLDPEEDLKKARAEDPTLEEFIQLLLRTTGHKKDDIEE